MSVLMNYKRTVEDFKKCTSKAATVYNIAFISDCIGSEAGRKLTCPDLQRPVPCGDGTCHSDYISCLRVRYFLFVRIIEIILLFKICTNLFL